MIRFVMIALLCAGAVAGCSEARSSDDAQPPDTNSVSDVIAPDTSDAATTDDGPSLASVVINEIHASGGDWVELFNAGTTSVDLSNAAVADTDDGGPRILGAARFPTGTVLLPGAYILVVAGYDDASTGPSSGCLDGGTGGPCIEASWGISASRGETVYFLSPGNSVLSHADYPMGGVPSGQSFGRLPNGTGAFAPNQPTPGAANVAP